MNAQVEIDDESDVYFMSDSPLPVEILKQKGSFYPVDKTTGEISQTKMFKCESYIHDPSKHHPTFYEMYSPEKRNDGKYLATSSMGYFQGKFQTRLLYKQCTELEFNKAIESNKGKISSWVTDLKVEVYGSEQAGRGFNHEAYLLDTIRNRPILMDCYNREKLQAGVYDLTVELVRIKGKLIPVNNYIFISEHKKPVLVDAIDPEFDDFQEHLNTDMNDVIDQVADLKEIPSTAEKDIKKAHIQALKTNKDLNK